MGPRPYPPKPLPLKSLGASSHKVRTRTPPACTHMCHSLTGGINLYQPQSALFDIFIYVARTCVNQKLIVAANPMGSILISTLSALLCIRKKTPVKEAYSDLYTTRWGKKVADIRVELIGLGL